MLGLIGFAAFFFGAYLCYIAFEYYKLFRTGVHATAIVTEIEQVLPEEDEDIIIYYLHLDLPDYNGVQLGKKYEKTINPRRYAVGDVVEIIHHKDRPTELVIKKELALMENPIYCLILGFFFLLFSYLSCNSIH